MIVQKPITWRHLWLNHMVSTIFPEAPEDSMMSWWACGALSRGYRGPTTGRSHPASIPEKSSAAHSLLSSWRRSTAGHLSLTLPVSLLSCRAFYWFAYWIMGTFWPRYWMYTRQNVKQQQQQQLDNKCLNRNGSFTAVAKDSTTPTAVPSLAMRSLGLISTGALEPTIWKMKVKGKGIQPLSLFKGAVCTNFKFLDSLSL